MKKIEIQDAKEMEIDHEKDYPVFEDFNTKKQVATCRVKKENDELHAEFTVKLPIISVTGYPAIAYRKDTNTGKITLMSVSICSQPNVDPNIPEITIKRN